MNHDSNVSDQRRHTRFEIFEYVLIYVDTVPEPIPAVIVDISLGGLQVRSRAFPQPGELVQLTIGQGDGVPLVVNAETRYTHPVDGGDLFATGFRFLPHDLAERMRLVNYIHDTFQRQGEVLLS